MVLSYTQYMARRTALKPRYFAEFTVIYQNSYSIHWAKLTQRTLLPLLLMKPHSVCPFPTSTLFATEKKNWKYLF